MNIGKPSNGNADVVILSDVETGIQNKVQCEGGNSLGVAFTGFAGKGSPVGNVSAGVDGDAVGKVGDTVGDVVGKTAPRQLA